MKDFITYVNASSVREAMAESGMVIGEDMSGEGHVVTGLEAVKIGFKLFEVHVYIGKQSETQFVFEMDSLMRVIKKRANHFLVSND